MKKLTLFLCIACSFLLFISTSAFSEHAVSDIQKIIKRKKIIVAIPEFDYSLFFYKDKKTGKLEGWDVDIARDIAKELGVEIVFNRQAKSYDDIVNVIAAGKADMAINLSETLARGKKTLFTEPYITLHQTLLINRLWLAKYNREITPDYHAVNVIKKEKIILGVMSGTVYVDFAKTMFPDATIKCYHDRNSLITAAKQGEINAIFDDDFEVKKYMLEHPSFGLTFKAIIFRNTKDFIGMTVQWSDITLLHWLNLYIRIKDIPTDVNTLLLESPIIKSANV